MMEKGHNRVQTGSSGKIQERITRVCKVCGKEGRQNEIENHIEAKHITGLTHSCDICGNKAKTKISMNHKSKYHRQEAQSTTTHLFSSILFICLISHGWTSQQLSVFLAVQDSSIGDIVSQSLSHLLISACNHHNHYNH